MEQDKHDFIVERKDGASLKIQSEVYFLDEMDEIADMMKLKDEEGQLRGREKTSAEVLTEFLAFYGIGEYAKS